MDYTENKYGVRHNHKMSTNQELYPSFYSQFTNNPSVNMQSINLMLSIRPM